MLYVERRLEQLRAAGTLGIRFARPEGRLARSQAGHYLWPVFLSALRRGFCQNAGGFFSDAVGSGTANVRACRHRALKRQYLMDVFADRGVEGTKLFHRQIC